VIKDLKRIISTTSNVWLLPILRFSKNKRRVVFRNGLSFELSWREYCSIVLVITDYGYTLGEICGLPCFIKGKMKLVVPVNYLDILYELNDEMYNVDFTNKVVLDVGGFMGDTAVYFASRGAKKVIVYEPVAYHNEFGKMNIQLNGVNAELHEAGVGDVNGCKTIYHKSLGMDFGLNVGNKKMEIKTISVRKMIEESNADIAKFDCEGAEESLLNVTSDVLQKIPFYIIEVHSTRIKNSIITKFEIANFQVVRDFSPFMYFPKHGKTIGEISVIFLSRR
jgi:FkbM family methyltransferase